MKKCRDITFLGTAALGATFALVAFAAVAALVVEIFAGTLAAGLVVLLPLLIGLFSLAESFLAASLTLPDGPKKCKGRLGQWMVVDESRDTPLGRENLPLSAPFLIERLS